MELKSLTDARCFDEQRRAALLDHPTLNGIDFVEYFEDRTVTPHRYWLVLTFLKPSPPLTTVPDLVNKPDNFRIEGGTRVVNIKVTEVKAGAQPTQLELRVNEPGDFSIYTLHVKGNDLDPHFSSIAFSFKASCPSEFDCRTEPDCPPDILTEPALDYLAKDYASFRRLLLDLIPQRNPRWVERNPADLGMALVELLAYKGDYLSYFQDAVATESFLDTCRRRVSARRHARLIDYKMHDGRNSWGFVQVDVSSSGIIERGTMLITRIAHPLSGKPSPPGTTIARNDLKFDSDPALQDAHVFETTAQVAVDPLNNLMRIHTWGDTDCCLARGSLGAYLYTTVRDIAGVETAFRPALASGDLVVLEEVKSPATGLTADRDPAHRQVVRLVSVETTDDPVYRNVLANGQPQPVTVAGQTTLPLLKVRWREEDALTFPLCISIKHPETDLLTDVSIARGNVMPCDHGRTTEKPLPLPATSGGRTGLLQTRVADAPLTFHSAPAEPHYDSKDHLSDRFDLDMSAREAQPAITLVMKFPPNEEEVWTPVPDLLASHPFDRQFVVEAENDGSATLRFGDDEYGRLPSDVISVTGRYRIGNGTAGNIGSGSLAHIVSPVNLANWPTIENVWQPLQTYGGTEPETIEEVRQLAPRAFQAEQFRAVTEVDYERAVLKLQSVAAAKCTFRWTGSWQTVFVAIHPRNPVDLITEAGGRTRLSERLEQKARAQLMRYKLAGYDLEVLTAQYVPLELSVEICVARGHFRGDVLEGVARALSNRQYADGTTGFFHPSRFGFGQGIYLSKIYAAVEKVEGVDSAVIKIFKRYWMLPNNELENGFLPVGSSEIARLDNDPNFMENGVLRLKAVGGL